MSSEYNYIRPSGQATRALVETPSKRDSIVEPSFPKRSSTNYADALESQSAASQTPAAGDSESKADPVSHSTVGQTLGRAQSYSLSDQKRAAMEPSLTQTGPGYTSSKST